MWMIFAKVSIVNSRFWVRGWRRDCVVVVREDRDGEEEDEGLWSFDAESEAEVSDWRVCNAAI